MLPLIAACLECSLSQYAEVSHFASALTAAGNEYVHVLRTRNVSTASIVDIARINFVFIIVSPASPSLSSLLLFLGLLIL